MEVTTSQNNHTIIVYVCSLCKDVFKSNKAVAHHMINTHANEISIQSLNDKKHMYQPQRKASKIVKRRYSKSYECTECAYKTVYRTSLKRHVQTHQKDSNQKQCPYCSYSAIQSPNLKRHILNQHFKTR